MVAFIDDHRAEYGVEPICRVLPIAPSTYYACKAIEADPTKASERAQRDAWLRPQITNPKISHCGHTCLSTSAHSVPLWALPPHPLGGMVGVLSPNVIQKTDGTLKICCSQTVPWLV